MEILILESQERDEVLSFFLSGGTGQRQEQQRW